MSKLLATAVIIGLAGSPAMAGQPHPQMFKYLQDQATANRAQDYGDCSRPTARRVASGPRSTPTAPPRRGRSITTWMGSQ